MSTETVAAPVNHVFGRVLKFCPFCGMEVCTHEAGFTHVYNPNCFLFVMNANNGLLFSRGVYLEKLYAAWDMRAEIAPNPGDELQGAEGASNAR